MLGVWYIKEKYALLSVQVKASFWFLICSVLQRLISIITTPIYTRMLSTYEYGQYGIFITWKSLLSCFITLNIFSGIFMQSIIKHEDERAKYTSAIEGLTLTMVVIWFAVYFVSRTIWNEKIGLNTSQMVAMFVIMWGNSVFGFWSVEQMIDYNYRGLIAVSLLMTIVQPTLCVLFIQLFNDKVTSLVWGIAVSTLTIYLLFFFVHMRKGKVFFSKEIWKYTLGFAIPLVPHYISSMVLTSSDRIMIQQLIGESEAGIYNLAYTISICGTMINQAILQTFSPWIYHKIRDRRFIDIPKAAYMILIAISLINLAIVLVLPEITKIFAPPAYYDAIWVMLPIALSVMFMFMYNIFSCFEFYYEKKMYVSTATMIGAGVNVVLNYIFIQKFGYIAAGYTTLACYILFAFMHYFFMCKVIQENIGNLKIYRARIIFLIAAVYLIAGFLILLTYKKTCLRYSIIAVCTIALIIFSKKLMLYANLILRLKKSPKNWDSDGERLLFRDK